MLPESSSPHGEAKIGASADANGGVKNKAKAKAKASSADATYPQAQSNNESLRDGIASTQSEQFRQPLLEHQGS